jgi:hypothetical protein
MSIAPGYQELFVSRDLPREERIQAEAPREVVERLSSLPEFVRSYAPDGMLPEDFITYGVTQRTLSQFYDAGWKLLETWGML